MQNGIKIGIGALALTTILALGSARGNAQMFMTPAGSVNPSDGQMVNAEALFTVANGVLTIDLTDLLVNPTADSQNLSDIFFTLNSGLTNGASADANVTSQTGTLITVESNTKPYATASGTADWVLSNGPSWHLSAIGLAHAKHTIIGAPDASGNYSNANGSITGDTHNPYFDQTAEFKLNIDGLTTSDFVSAATFSFGTAAGEDVTGTCVTNCGGGPTGNPTPEPGTMAMLMGACVPFSALAIRRIRR